ncbi:MAG: ABC transporter permease [Anaerolineae bacterium]|nr:ABC transporter permease [Anaerolineae bacterium]
MYKLIVSRLIQGVFTTWAVVTVVFLLIRVSGDPVDMFYGGAATREALREAEAMRRQYGLDKSVPEQYVDYLTDLLRLDFGSSIHLKRPVVDLIGERIPHTLRLTVVAFMVSYLIAIPLGVLAALRRGTAFDYTSLGLTMVGVSLPAFWLGLMLILLFSVQLNWLPASGIGDATLQGRVRHLILPAITLAIPRMAVMTRFIRGTMLDILGADYLTTARAKGMRERAVIMRHGFRNALIPIVTLIGLQLGFLVGGAVVIERVFGLPGVGDLVVDAISGRDFPVVQASVLMLAISVVIANTAVDILYGYVDPRVRTE